ncbi:MAG TPA: hypothetical protein VGI99_00525, partial [Gemmataceae bacterium]
MFPRRTPGYNRGPMRNFLRTLKYSLPYRYRLIASVACAIVVAILWSINLSAIYPVLKILGTDKNLQQWVDEEIDGAQKHLNANQAKLVQRQDALQNILNHPNHPDRENNERKERWEITKLEAEQSDLGSRLYRFQLL